MLDEVAPNQSDQLWQSLVTSKSFGQHPFNDDEEREDEVLMQALAECYRNANNWQTRRQILYNNGGQGLIQSASKMDSKPDAVSVQ